MPHPDRGWENSMFSSNYYMYTCCSVSATRVWHLPVGSHAHIAHRWPQLLHLGHEGTSCMCYNMLCPHPGVQDKACFPRKITHDLWVDPVCIAAYRCRRAFGRGMVEDDMVRRGTRKAETYLWRYCCVQQLGPGVGVSCLFYLQ